MLSGRTQVHDTDKTLCAMIKFGQMLTTFCKNDDGAELDIFPWLRFFGHKLYKQLIKTLYLRDNLWDVMWYHSQKNYTSDGDATCVLHAIGQLLDKNSPYYNSSVTWEHARAAFLDLIMTIYDLVPTFAYILPNILVQNPRILQQLRNEVDIVIGTERQPNIIYCDLMPYTMANIYELLRYGSLISTIPHKTLEDTSVGGFCIPKDTIVLPLFSAVHSDLIFWGDPEIYRPERFLDDHGFILPVDHPRRKHVLQFGAGIRMCVAEGFALMRLLIFVATIVQAFDILPGEGIPVSYNPITFKKANPLTPLSYKVKLISRQ